MNKRKRERRHEREAGQRARRDRQEQKTWATCKTPSGFNSSGQCSTWSIHSSKTSLERGVEEEEGAQCLVTKIERVGFEKRGDLRDVILISMK